jgi:hypothetical protein
MSYAAPHRSRLGARLMMGAMTAIDAVAIEEVGQPLLLAS